MRAFRSALGLGFLATAMVAGCVSSEPRSRSRDASADASRDAGRIGRRDGGPSDASYTYDVWVDPGCPGGPVERDGGAVFVRTCDPYAPGACGPGAACYPVVTYPTGPCGDEVFLTECWPAGPGGQGDHCVSTFDCEHGYSCFVTGEGNQCLQLCDQSGGEPRCPRGLICGWTDLPEFGACN